MSIDQKYGYEPLAEALRVPLARFPEAVYQRLFGELDKISELWRELDIDAFGHGSSVFLRLTLDVGDRPLHLLVHEDGEVLQFDAPITADFPAESSYFVLTELCGNNTYLSFRVDSQNKCQAEASTASQRNTRTDVLMAWGRFEFTTFLTVAPMLLPYLIVKLTEAERDLRQFWDNPPPQVRLAA